MIKFVLLIAINVTGLFAFAGNPPANYPAVNGVVKKIDLVNKTITLKHETIPNLNMPGMTMPFIFEDAKLIQGLKVGDQVHFAADENADGDLLVIWIEKAQNTPITIQSPIICTGSANTSPKTNIEIDIRADKFSTIRYEFAEGSLKGTAYINSIGRMLPNQDGNHYVYQSGEGELDSKLRFDKLGDQIQNAYFYNFSAGMNFEKVTCSFQN